MCEVEDCTDLARGRYCRTHKWRVQHGLPLSGPVNRSQSRKNPLSPWELLVESAIAVADSDSQDDEQFVRARDRLRKAALAYARHVDRGERGTAVRRGGA